MYRGRDRRYCKTFFVTGTQMKLLLLLLLIRFREVIFIDTVQVYIITEDAF